MVVVDWFANIAYWFGLCLLAGSGCCAWCLIRLLFVVGCVWLWFWVWFLLGVVGAIVCLCFGLWWCASVCLVYYFVGLVVGWLVWLRVVWLV